MLMENGLSLWVKFLCEYKKQKYSPFNVLNHLQLDLLWIVFDSTAEFPKLLEDELQNDEIT